MNNSSVKSIKNTVYVFLFIIGSTQAHAQNKLQESAINYQMLVPIGCVIGFAFFMFHAFMKHKDN